MTDKPKENRAVSVMIDMVESARTPQELERALTTVRMAIHAIGKGWIEPEDFVRIAEEPEVSVRTL